MASISSGMSFSPSNMLSDEMKTRMQGVSSDKTVREELAKSLS